MTLPDKRDIQGVLVKLLRHKRDDRGMTLAAYESRCLRAGEIHELVTTDQSDATAGNRIDRVGFLGFVEIGRAGVVERGDAVRHCGVVVGTVLGFDECHFPNHYNILIAVDRPCTAVDLKMQVGDLITFDNNPL